MSFYKVLGFEVVTDDYITKPFSIDELVARVKANLQRQQRLQLSEDHDLLNYPKLLINKKTYEVLKEGEKIELSTKEFQLLTFLAEHPNQVLSREQIYKAIWGENIYGWL